MHGHSAGHHSPPSETVALYGVFADAESAAGNITTFDQAATVVATAVPATVTNPNGTPEVFLPKQANGRFNVQGTTSGLVNANVTGGTVQLQSSVDGGATWQVKKQVELPIISAGAAATTEASVVAVVDLSGTIAALGARFRLFVTLIGAGGTYTTLISEGGIVAQELPN